MKILKYKKSVKVSKKKYRQIRNRILLCKLRREIIKISNKSIYEFGNFNKKVRVDIFKIKIEKD